MICRKMKITLLGLLTLLALTNVCRAQQTPGPGAKPATVMPDVIQVPNAAQASEHFDADAATEAYLAQIPASARSRSDAYFEGGYWLILWDFLCGAAIYILLLYLGWSAAMRDFAERITRFKPLQSFIYWTEFMVVTTILGAPLGVYEGFYRERQYGLATQTLGPWLGDQLIIVVVNVVFGGLLAMLLIGLVRRFPRTWWIWCASASIVFLIFFIMIAPVFLFPLLNKYTVLENPKVTEPILSLARANGIPAQKVYTMDASKQTTRMSANVSGYEQTMRITLNDNLLRRGSLEEIQSIMGHEMGHYVLHHIAKDILYYSVIIVIFFAFLYWSLERALARWGERWKIRGIGDTAIIPLVFLIGTLLGFVYTPFFNTHIRTNEHEADMYGLNASRQPDGFAQGAIHLGEYRKMSPSTVEEWIFFDHPSGRNRIHDAMRWKAENLQLFVPKSDH
ncbi:MAG TPA: M48 family metallopeptidase [Candidatus Acidoferrum sp.]|nr:M48 family metallopeptidase [Candidatus Acidoferrum sp.]